MSVEAEMIRAKGDEGEEEDDDRRSGGRGGGGSSKKLEQGDKVEARHGGGSKWYPGTITRCRLNGSYDIRYDDGDREQGVKADLVRGLDDGKGGRDDDRGSRRGGGGGGRGGKLEEGQKVKCDFKGRGRYYPGKIARCRLNGTYDIHYDDGERETGVEKGMIKALEDDRRDDDDESPRGGRGRSSSSKKKLEQGDKVEARHGGGSKWYPGTITRCRLNGSYDIRYDDGDREQGVKADLVRGLDAGGSSSSSRGSSAAMEFSPPSKSRGSSAAMEFS